MRPGKYYEQEAIYCANSLREFNGGLFILASTAVSRRQRGPPGIFPFSHLATANLVYHILQVALELNCV